MPNVTCLWGITNQNCSAVPLCASLGGNVTTKGSRLGKRHSGFPQGLYMTPTQPATPGHSPGKMRRYIHANACAQVRLSLT